MSATTTQTITEFLEQRLSEDQAAAEDATRGPWTDDAMEGDVWAPSNRERICRTSAAAWFQDAAHIARHDPARVLAEVAAKREIIESVANEAIRYGVEPEQLHSGRILRALASVYASHPSFDRSWLL